MIDTLYIAWRYVCQERIKAIVLIGALSLIVFLPVALDKLVNHGAAQLRRRAAQTPLILGARGSQVELVLNTLYFNSQTPPTARMSEVDRIRQSGLATTIPIYCQFTARDTPIVATTLEYFEFRHLAIDSGINLTTIGECVVGAAAAENLNLKPGDSLLSNSDNAFDLAGTYPLKMHVVGILKRTDTPDDSAIFVDLKTAWIIAGLGHGHADVSTLNKDEFVLDQDSDRVSLNAAVMQYTEVTPENIDSFHFHGDMSEYPINAIIAVPNDDKSGTLLQGHYLADDEVTQALQPIEVMDELLVTVLRIRSVMVSGTILIAMSTIATVVLVFLLSLRLRRNEIETMKRIGGSRSRIAAIIGWEIFLVSGLSVILAFLGSLLVSNFGETIIRSFLL